jgi:F-type H+-transporting ATPase subunit alpha
MKGVAGRLRIDLAQYRELVAFAQFGSELDKVTQAQLTRGERMTEILKQGQYEPLPLSKQVMIIYAGTKGYLDDMPLDWIKKFESDFYKFMGEKYPDVEHEIETKKELSDALTKKLDKAILEFKNQFSEPLVKNDTIT